MQKKNNKNEDWLYSDLTYEIRGAIFDVRKELGSAFKESVYQKALEQAFGKRNISFVSQPMINIIYDGKKIGMYKPDFVIEGKILIELKVMSSLTKREEKQLWYYLKGTTYKLGLLVNFGSTEVEIKRWIYDKAREKYK